MIGTYGIARVSIGTVTDANVQFKEDTDLGIVVEAQTSENVIPAKGSAATFTTVAVGGGYTIGKDKTLVQTATDGSGVGLKVVTNIVEDEGILIVESGLQPTANFNNYQNTLRYNFDPANPDPYTYARVTATGAAFTGVSNAIPGVSATGTAATFIVTVNAGLVTNIIVAAGGTVYRIGDVVTIDKATLELNGSFGGGIVFQGDLQFLVTEDNVLGRIEGSGLAVKIQNGGSGHAIGDVITLSEEGSTVVGTGGVTIGTLGGALNTAGDLTIYPTGVINTSGAVGPIQVIDMGGNTVVLGACQPGVIRKFAFQQVLGAGTGPGVGLVTVLY